ncbi:MAG: alkaline phosphatase family protein, partial [bacterium]
GSKRLHRLIHIYLPGTDCHSHRYGPESQRDYLVRTLDPLVGGVLEALRGRQPLEEFYFVLTADHAQAGVAPDREHAVTPERVARALAAAGRTAHDPHETGIPRRASAVAFNHGGSCLVYLRNSETGRWHTLPGLERDLLGTAAAITEVSGRRFEGMPPGWIDLILVRDHEKGRYVVCDTGGAVEAVEFFGRAGNRGRYPDAARRLRGLSGKRCPDMVLLANYERGFHFGKRVEAGQHGSLCAEDSVVPMLFAGPGITPDVIPGSCSIIDVAPTIAALFDVPIPSADGRILPIF